MTYCRLARKPAACLSPVPGRSLSSGSAHNGIQLRLPQLLSRSLSLSAWHLLQPGEKRRPFRLPHTFSITLKEGRSPGLPHNCCTAGPPPRRARPPRALPPSGHPLPFSLVNDACVTLIAWAFIFDYASFPRLSLPPPPPGSMSSPPFWGGLLPRPAAALHAILGRPVAPRQPGATRGITGARGRHGPPTVAPWRPMQGATRGAPVRAPSPALSAPASRRGAARTMTQFASRAPQRRASRARACPEPNVGPRPTYRYYGG